MIEMTASKVRFPSTAHTQQKPDVTSPNFSTVQVTDIFQRLVSTSGSKHTEDIHLVFKVNAALTILELNINFSCCAGAPVSVLCKSSLGPGARDLSAEGRGRTGPHTQRRLSCAGGWSGTWRMCSSESLFFLCTSSFTSVQMMSNTFC